MDLIRMINRYDLIDLNNMVNDFHGTYEHNTMIYVKSDCHDKVMLPSNIYIDDDGDIIIECPCDYLTEKR